MQIGLIGHGKMGKSVEQQALGRSHAVTVLDPKALDARDLDCVIDFTHADVAPLAIAECLRQHVPVVSGTTGWNHQIQEIENLCIDLRGAFCWSPNFSLGMQLTFHLNAVLADLMNGKSQYTPEILEIHHISKQDSPSGTAIALAEQIIAKSDVLTHWKEESTGQSGVLPIHSRREEDVKGIHRITYKSAFDTISLRHHALSREGFAFGAIVAAEWIVGKEGCFRFEDVLCIPRRT